MSIVLAVVLLAATAVAARWLVAYIKFRRMELAIAGPPSLPVLGNALDLLGVTEDNVLQRLQELWGNRSEMMRISVLCNLFVVLSDPDDIGKLMKRKDLNDKGGLVYDYHTEIVPNSVAQLNGAKWKEHRKCIVPAFHPEVVDSFAEVFAEEAEAFAARIVPDTDVDLVDDLFLTESSSFLQASMTMRLQESDRKMAVKIVELIKLCLIMINNRSFNPLLWSNFIYSFTPSAKSIAQKRKEILDYSESIMVHKRATRATGGLGQFQGRRKTLVDVLLEDRQEGRSHLSDSDIKDEIVTFLAAAVETTTSALSCAFKVLSLKADVQERLHQEILTVMGNTKRSVGLADLSRLNYLERVLQETMRLLPPGPMIGRKTKEQVEFCGKTLPAGTMLVINIFGAHRDPRHWLDPLRFDPDRFLPEYSEGRHPYSYLPFSAGSRNCMGGRYAMLAMKSIVATVLRYYRVDAVDDGVTDLTDLPISFGLTLRIVGGSKVKFSRR